MILSVLANEAQQREFLSKPVPADVSINWVDSLQSLTMMEADAYFDLQYEWNPERNQRFKLIGAKPVFVNEITLPASFIGSNFIRINAWPGMLQRSLTELSVANATGADTAAAIMNQLNWLYQLTPDVPGMISARVIAMIINEAFFTYGDGVSTKADIDIAMKLGTNYPYGPFEWGEQIGLSHIYTLLKEMQRQNNRYEIAPALESELANRMKHKSSDA